MRAYYEWQTRNEKKKKNFTFVRLWFVIIVWADRGH